jgi:hypothetical protein
MCRLPFHTQSGDEDSPSLMVFCPIRFEPTLNALVIAGSGERR